MKVEVVIICVSEIKLEILDMYISPNLTFCDNATLVCKVRPSDGDVWWTFSGKNITEEERCVRLCKTYLSFSEAHVFSFSFLILCSYYVVEVSFMFQKQTSCSSSCISSNVKKVLYVI